MGATNLDMSGLIDPTLLQAQAGLGTGQETLGAGPNATTGTTILDTEVVGAEGDNNEDNNADVVSANKGNTINTSLLSQASDQPGNTASDANISSATDSASIDVQSVTPNFVTTEWKTENISFSSDDATWQENEDGTFTQSLILNPATLGIPGGNDEPIDVKYKWDAEGDFIGLSDGTEIAKSVTTKTDTIDGGAGNDTLENKSTINTEPIELNNGNLAYGFDSNNDGEIDTYRIEDSSGAEVETINADQFTGVDYAGLDAVPASTDEVFINMATTLGEDHVWNTGSEDLDGDGIPDGITNMDGEGNGLMATLIQEHTFADGSKGFVYTLPSNEITGMNQEPLFYFNEKGQVVDSEGKALTDQTTGSSDGDGDGDGDGDNNTVGDTGLTQDEYDTVVTTLETILVNTGSDTTEELVGYYNEISGLFATGEDGSLTEADQELLTAFWNTMIEQGETTGVIMSSKTMGDYFELVKEYTGQYNGTIAEADMDQFLADWLAESVLFVSGLDNSQKWSLDNINDHSQYENLQNLIELVYGEGRTLTAEEAMRYLTDYSWKLDGEWTYGVGGDGILDNELGLTNFLVQQMVLNARGPDQEYVTSFWLANEDLDLEAYGLTVEMIAEAWGTTAEELKINTAKAKKDNKKKQSSGSFFAPKDVVRIGDEDPGSSPQTVTGKGGRSRTKPNTLLGGSVMTTTLTGSN